MGCGSSKSVEVHPHATGQLREPKKHGNGEMPVLLEQNSEREERSREPSAKSNSVQKPTSVSIEDQPGQKHDVPNDGTTPAILYQTSKSQQHKEKIEVESYQPSRKSPEEGKENVDPNLNTEVTGEATETERALDEEGQKKQDEKDEKIKEEKDENNNSVYVEPEIFQPKEDKAAAESDPDKVTNNKLYPELPTDENNNTDDTMLVDGTDNLEKTTKILRKEDLYQDISIFKEVDEHVLKAPRDPSLSMKEIADYLITPFDSELLKLRAVWRWITANIEYDVDTFFGTTEKEQKDNSFSSRKGVCDGYSTITNDLFSLCGIESVKVRGWAKGYYYTPGKSIHDTAPNHAWNAVKLQNQWWLMDTTWGAGYVGQDRKFVWDYTEHYFLTDPKEFIFDHFPTDPQWQLLDDTADMEEFESWAKFTKHFFIYNLKALSYKIGTIDVSMGSADLCFEYPENTDFTVDLTHEETGKSMKECCFHFSSAGVVRFLVKVPQSGVHTLKLYAKKSTSDTKEYNSICNYRLRCSTAAAKWTPFPSFTGSWKEGFVLHEPLSGTLQKNTEVKFKIAAPENIVEMFVCVCGEETWLDMTKEEGGAWETSVTLNDTATGIKILANDINNSSDGYAVLLNYTVT